MEYMKNSENVEKAMAIVDKVLRENGYIESTPEIEGLTDRTYTDPKKDFYLYMDYSRHTDNYGKPWSCILTHSNRTEIRVSIVYRSNGTNENVSIRVSACKYMGSTGITVNQIKFRSEQTEKTIARKVMTIIEAERPVENDAVEAFVENGRYGTLERRVFKNSVTASCFKCADDGVFNNVFAEEVKFRRERGVELYGWQEKILEEMGK